MLSYSWSNDRFPIRNVPSLARTSPDSASVDVDDQFWLDICLYRVKYLFGPRSCCRFLRSLKRRFPTGVGVYVVLLMLGLEQFAFLSAGDQIIGHFMVAVSLSNSSSSRLPLVRSVGLKTVAKLLFPITGWLADVWVGRYQMIHLSLWLLWVGYALAAVLMSLGNMLWNKYLLLPCYTIIILGSAGFQANAIPFGTDQIQYKTTQELSSYFYMYYWMRNLSTLMLSLQITCDNFIQGVTYCMVGVLGISVMLSLNAVLKKDFATDYKKINPFKTIFKVLYLSLTIKRPRYRSAFSYNPAATQPSRLDLTKRTHGGKFEEETVEDVKTFLKLLGILASLGVVLLAHAGISNGVSDMYIPSINFKNVTGSGGTCVFNHLPAWSVNMGVILGFILCMNLGLLPFLQEYTPSMLKKIGTGAMIVATTSVAFIVVAMTSLYKNSGSFKCHSMGQGQGSPFPLWSILTPFALVTIAEVLINVSSLEFFYAQSPHNMRGMMVGLFFFTLGITSVLAELVIHAFQDNQFGNCDIYYYLLYLMVGMVGFLLFVGVARKYRNRERGEIKPMTFYRQ